MSTDAHPNPPRDDFSTCLSVISSWCNSVHVTRKAIPFPVKSLVESWRICFQDPQFKIAITQQQGAASQTDWFIFKVWKHGLEPGKEGCDGYRASVISWSRCQCELWASLTCWSTCNWQVAAGSGAAECWGCSGGLRGLPKLLSTGSSRLWG